MLRRSDEAIERGEDFNALSGTCERVGAPEAFLGLGLRGPLGPERAVDAESPVSRHPPTRRSQPRRSACGMGPVYKPHRHP
jgi:hypothetical protein